MDNDKAIQANKTTAAHRSAAIRDHLCRLRVIHRMLQPQHVLFSRRAVNLTSEVNRTLAAGTVIHSCDHRTMRRLQSTKRSIERGCQRQMLLASVLHRSITLEHQELRWLRFPARALLALRNSGSLETINKRSTVRVHVFQSTTRPRLTTSLLSTIKPHSMHQDLALAKLAYLQPTAALSFKANLRRPTIRTTTLVQPTGETGILLTRFSKPPRC